MIKALK